MKAIEFFTSPEGDVLFSTEKCIVTELSENETVLIDVLFEKIRTDYPDAFTALSDEYDKSVRNLPYFRFLVVRRFIRCNMSNFDTLAIDFDSEGIFHFEQVSCPMRGECKLYKIVCSPKYNSHLTKTELRILAMYCQPMEMDSIASELYMSPHTVDTHLKNIRRKTECHSKAELMKFYEKIKQT
ncbi:MAG TPA: helix-turn-helix transcriptional regulator [Paludibacter sp.]|nr:helix-turn-helix transcriptional regulator [Paludibacter sp.]